MKIWCSNCESEMKSTGILKQTEFFACVKCTARIALQQKSEKDIAKHFLDIDFEKLEEAAKLSASAGRELSANIRDSLECD